MGWVYEHEHDCLVYLDIDYHEVHAWLDGCIKKYPVEQYNIFHRKFRHNWYGVEYCKEKWGPGGEKAALLHLVRDRFFMLPVKDLDQLLQLGREIAEEGLYYPYPKWVD